MTPEAGGHPGTFAADALLASSEQDTHVCSRGRRQQVSFSDYAATGEAGQYVAENPGLPGK